jgi:hypothetical protein
VGGVHVDNFIRFRISPENKKKFQGICSKKAINQSALLRKFIQQWIIKNEGGNKDG